MAYFWLHCQCWMGVAPKNILIVVVLFSGFLPLRSADDVLPSTRLNTESLRV